MAINAVVVLGTGFVGAMIRGMLENFVKDELQARGYQPVYTPNIGKVDLYETSGHFPYYSDSMFAPIMMETVYPVNGKMQSAAIRMTES